MASTIIPGIADDVLVDIFEFLDVDSTVRLAQTRRALRDLLIHENVLNSRFPPSKIKLGEGDILTYF